jgi:hypothetical protein
MNNKPGYLRGNTSGDDVLDKPIKAKTLKKKLEKTLTYDKAVKIIKNFNKNYKPSDPIKLLEDACKTSYDMPKCKCNNKTLQNNKPSIELIEKLDYNTLITQTPISYLDETFIIKINKIIDKLNEINVRLNLLDEEDYD